MLRWLFVLLLAGLARGPRSSAAESPDFDRQVAPILASRCLDCHSGPEPKGKLDLSQSKTARAGGESGPALAPGKVEESYLWERIADNEMPPKHPLPAAEREVIKSWIANGANWGTDPIDPFRYTSASRAGYDWWSLQPLASPQVPEIRNPQSAIQNPIDAFVLAQLEAKDLAPSPRADPRTLIRRLYFDLIGLPPTPEEAEQFEAASLRDPHSAIRNLVDKLLDSPHYGERWARHWLDIVHFGESDGFEFDRMRPSAWRYRDWVINALNQDMPFDRFARLQIAGDVVEPNAHDATIATGFLVGGAHDGLMPKSESMRTMMRQDELEELVSLVSQTFLGFTVNCARCHDHKFDPIRAADYYRLASALSGVKRGNRDLPLDPPTEMVKAHDRFAKELSELVTPVREAILARRRAGAGEQRFPPQPIASWDFDVDLKDSIGTLHAAAKGIAKVEHGALVLDGKDAFATTTPLDRDLSEKTLEVWVRLETLDQRGGGAMSVQTPDGNVFDAIVFGEKDPKRWISGSDFFRRTQPFEGGPEEVAAAERFIHLAIAYQSDGQIRAYRDGQPYGKPYQVTAPVKFEKGKAQVVFGLRHSPPGGDKLLAGKIDRARLYDRALSADEIAASAGTVRTFISDEELIAELDQPARARRERLAAELARLQAEIQTYKDRKAFAVTPQSAPVMSVLLRGNYLQPGEVVAAGGIQSLTASQPDFGMPADAPEADRRRKLAEWIANAKNPLFARTIVNRLWHYHFGRGLVETTSDLGFSGGKPSHPDLLDWLASEVVARQWSLKELHRLIVTSATYQQASQPRADAVAVDADNRLLWRYSPRRLEAEAVRDWALAITGQLNPQIGGPSYMDFRPFEFKTTQYYEPLDPVGSEFNRRSIYRFWARGGKNPLLDTFDCPDPSTATPRRGMTTTPLQALALMNNSFTLRMADHFAERLEKERPASAEQQLTRAFQLAYGRMPNEQELAVGKKFARDHGLSAFCRVLLNSNGFLYVN